MDVLALTPYRNKLDVTCQQFNFNAQISASGIQEILRAGLLLNDVVKPVVGTHGTERRAPDPITSPRGIIKQPDMKWAAPSGKKASSAPPGLYIHLYNRSSRKYTVVFAKIDATIREASISRRIVTGFGILPGEYCSTSQLGNSVVLTCDTGLGKAYESYRFRIVEGCSFDVCVSPNEGPLRYLIGKGRGGASELHQ